MWNEEGQWIQGEEELANYSINYFKNLMSSCNPPRGHVEKVMECVTFKVSPVMNNRLLADFSKSDVKEAIFSMKDLSSPGLDGFPPIFYKDNWNLVGDLVLADILKILNDKELVAKFNETLLVLIPKCKNPASMKDFHPIALCNVFYKIMSKMIANRLKTVLEEIISPEQAAFLKGRFLSDNFIIAAETLHFLRTKDSAEGSVAINLDVAKAYDRVECIP